MSLHITLTDEFEPGKRNISYRGKKNIPGSVAVPSWPSSGGAPIRKKECYYSSGLVFAKTEQMLTNEYAAIKLNEIKELVSNDFPDSSKDVSALIAQYKIIKSASFGWTTIAQVDTAYDNFIAFMDLS